VTSTWTPARSGTAAPARARAPFRTGRCRPRRPRSGRPASGTRCASRSLRPAERLRRSRRRSRSAPTAAARARAAPRPAATQTDGQHHHTRGAPSVPEPSPLHRARRDGVDRPRRVDRAVSTAPCRPRRVDRAVGHPPDSFHSPGGPTSGRHRMQPPEWSGYSPRRGAHRSDRSDHVRPAPSPPRRSLTSDWLLRRGVLCCRSFPRPGRIDHERRHGPSRK
jgi:hypothetical protein